MQKLYMTLLDHKQQEELFQSLMTHARFMFTALFVVI